MVPPPPNCDPEFLNKPFFITRVDMYSISRYNMLHVVLEKVDEKINLFRPNFMLGCRVTYPKECSINSPRKPFNQLTFVTKAFHLRIGLDMKRNKFSKKTVLISSWEEAGANPNYGRLSDLTVVSHLSRGILKGRLALLRLGSRSRVWETGFCSQVFDAIGTYKGKLCALDEFGRLFVMDYDSLQMILLGPPLSIARNPRSTYLIEVREELFVVDKTQPNYVAYKLSLQQNKWSRVSWLNLRSRVPWLNLQDQLVALKPFFV